MSLGRLPSLLSCAAFVSCAPAPAPVSTPATATATPTVAATTARPAPSSERDFVQAHKAPLTAGATHDAFLRQVGSATVIGLGEQTHGSDQNATARTALARLLVERHDVRAIALEADYVEILPIDAYVQGGAGDPTKLLARQRAGWIWDKPALRELLVWLRELNARRPAEERVHLVGIDMQTASAILQAIIHTFDTDRLRVALRMTLSKVTSCTDPALERATTQLQAFSQSKPQLVPLLRSLDQCKAASQEDPAGTVARERGMADNVIALARGPSRVRVVVLAHNAHVAKVPLAASETSSMGSVLASELQANYVAVATILGDGDFRAYRFDPQAGRSNTTEMLALGAPSQDTLEAVLKDAQSYFLPLAGWPGAPRKMRIVGASYAPDYAEHYLHLVPVARAFDGLLYLPHA